MRYSRDVGRLVFAYFSGSIFRLAYISNRNLGLIAIALFITDVIALLVLAVLLGTSQARKTLLHINRL